VTASYALSAIGFVVAVLGFCWLCVTALGHSERFTRTLDALHTCPECAGSGYGVTSRDRDGQYADRRCQLCHGAGTASDEQIEAYAQYVEEWAS
jgi:aminoglycoside phosphotransferase (APT) family kinase protein